jgi:hypothetical protein
MAVEKESKPLGGDAPEWTDRNAKARVHNNWGADLNSVTLRHRRSNDRNKQDERTWYNLSSGADTPADLDIRYETGIGADFDYWWVTFQLTNGDVYVSKNSFFCNLTADDEGGIVTAVIDLQYKRLTIVCPKSTDCDTDSIVQSGSDEAATPDYDDPEPSASS